MLTGVAVNIIPFTNPAQLQRQVSYRPFQAATPEQAEAAFRAACPTYDPGMAYWHTPTKTLMVPWDWKGEEKKL